jgi:preprotein translocase subunit SecA
MMRALEKAFLIDIIDQHWKEHLLQLDHLRQTVSLRAYGQRDPLNEYKAESFEMFQVMLEQIRSMTTFALANAEIRAEGIPEDFGNQSDPDQMVESHGEEDFNQEPVQQPMRSKVDAGQRNPGDPRTWGKVARNEACPCGSGKKYKHCHGAIS